MEITKKQVNNIINEYIESTRFEKVWNWDIKIKGNEIKIHWGYLDYIGADTDYYKIIKDYCDIMEEDEFTIYDEVGTPVDIRTEFKLAIEGLVYHLKTRY